MNKPFIYSTEILRSFDILWMVKYMQIAISQMIHTFTGSSNAFVDGASATETGTPSMVINIAEGVIYQQAPIDPTEWGALDADNTLIIQQGYKAAHTVTLSTSGLSSGQSRWALIEAKFATVDEIHPDDPTGGVVGFWNAGNPSQPFLGPANSGATLPTVRFGNMVTQVTYGAPATTGSQVAPTVSSGFVPLYLVLLTNGQTTITNGQILKAGPSVGTGVPGDYTRAPFNTGLYAHHHTGAAGAAPKVSLTTEVEDVLPFGNLPATNANPPALSKVVAYGSGSVSPQGARAGELGDQYRNTTTGIEFRCTTAGDASTAVWTALGLAETVFSTASSLSLAGKIEKVISMRPTANSTIALDPAANMLGSFITIRNDLELGSAYTVTIDPNGSELIDDKTTLVLYPGMVVTIYPRVITGTGSWRLASGAIGKPFGGNGGRQMPTSGTLSGVYYHSGDWTSTGALTLKSGFRAFVAGTITLNHDAVVDFGVAGGLGSFVVAQSPSDGNGPCAGKSVFADRCGGGGGGNGGKGGNGGSSTTDNFANGGSAISIDEYFGGSSGAGGACTGSDAGGKGGAAGGNIYMEATVDIILNATIAANGEVGEAGTENNGAGGGGGSGGTVELRAGRNIDITSGGIEAMGGDGGVGGGNSGGHGGKGGPGGGGNVRCWAGNTVSGSGNVVIAPGEIPTTGSSSQNATAADDGIYEEIEGYRPSSRF